MRRARVGTMLALALAVAAGITFAGLWQREHPGEKLFGRSDAYPVLTGVTAIRVSAHYRGGVELVNEIRDARAIADILAGMGHAQRSYFSDPELAGALYQVEFVQGSASRVFELNDLRGTGSTIPGKIYPQHPQRDEVWALPAGLVAALTEDAPACRAGGTTNTVGPCAASDSMSTSVS